MRSLPVIAGRLTRSLSRSPIGYCLAVVLISRLALLLVGHLSQAFMGSQTGLAPSERIGDLLNRWDADWYLLIVRGGYKLSTDYSGIGQTNVAFFPLLPAVMILTSIFVPLKVTALLLPNLFLLVGCVALHQYVKQRFGDTIANLAVMSVCCFPGSFLFSSVMTESLFFMLAVLSFRYLNSRQWLTASVGAALLSVTRVNGLAVGCAFGIAWWRDRLVLGRTPTLFRELLLILLIPLPLFVFMGFLYWRFGDAFAAFNAHRYFWSNSIVWPFENLFYIFYGDDLRARFHAGLALVVVAFFILEIRNFTLEEVSFVTISLLATTSTQFGGLFSTARYLLPLFPIHIALALASSRRAWAAPVIPCLAIINGFVMVLWSQGGTIFI